MADTKTSALSSLTSPADADVLPIVDTSETETKKITFASLLAAIVDGADLPTETAVAGFDDLTDPRLAAWSYTTSNGGLLRQSPSAAGAGFPGSGVGGLKVTTAAGSSVTAYRLLGLALDPVVPIVVDVRWNASIDADDECQWVLGVADALDTSAVLLLALWDAGTSTRSYALAISTAGVPAVTPITLPALTGTGYQGRFTLLPGSVVFECSGTDSADDLAVVETITATVPEAAYHLMMQAERATGAGNRMLLVDWWRWRAKRLADAAPVVDLFADVTAPVAVGAGVVSIAAASSDGASATAARVDHVHAHGAQAGGTTHADAIASGAAGFMSGADKAKLDGIAASAAAVGTGVVAVGRANSNGASSSAARADHVHDGGVISVTAVKTSAYTILDTDDVVLVDDTSGRVDLTAPSLASRGVMIQKVAGGTGGIRIIRTGSEDINGVAANYDLPGATTAWASATPQAWYLYSDATKRYVA